MNVTNIRDRVDSLMELVSTFLRCSFVYTHTHFTLILVLYVAGTNRETGNIELHCKIDVATAMKVASTDCFQQGECCLVLVFYCQNI